MHLWIIFAVIAGLGMLGYNMFAKFGGGALPPPVFAGVMYFAGFCGAMPIFIAYLLKQPEGVHGYLTGLPLWPVIFSACAGLVVIIVDLSVSKMFNLGAEVGLGMTAVFLISIFMTALIGYVFIKEDYSLINFIGLFFALIAIPMIFYGQK